MNRMVAVSAAFGLFLVLVQATPSAAQAPDKQGVEFFEKRIRPVLVKHCYKCHSSDSKEVMGELLLDTRDGIRRGGENGHAVVPGNLDESVLISAMRYDDFEMPPNEPLPDNVIADFEKWVEMGAPDPRDGKSALIRRVIDFDKAREFWAFRPIEKSEPPQVADKKWAWTDIDRFVAARQDAKEIKPVADASPEVLVRRIYYDLIGLPPTPEQVAEFMKDPSRSGVEALIDRLLDSPQFGERWGRHWLDVVRYAESTGKERNYTYPYAWRYRDYVIKAINEDKPFDRFIVEQVAGDLLPFDNIEQRNEQMIATGVLAFGTKSLNNNNRLVFQMDVVDDQIDVTTQAFIGLTASCARCHDHKFDPIPTKDYYALAGIFTSTQTFYGTGGGQGNRQAGRLLALGANGIAPASAGGGNNNRQLQRVKNQLRAAQRKLTQVRKQGGNNPNQAAKKRIAAAEAQVQKLQGQVRRLNRAAQPAAKPEEGAVLAMGVQDAAEPADTEVRVRGEAADRGESVPRGFLTILSASEGPHIDAAASGRLEYAQWLVKKDNPLTARVAVNRVWQHLFGRGIVPSVNNFGINGDRPSHPELLDYLAAEFVENGWSMKDLVRTVMTSRVYQLSATPNDAAAAVDPDNRLLWRRNQRRLEAEALRDSILAASGQLDLTPGKGSIVTSAGNGAIGRNIRPGQFASNHVQRSVYLPIVRGVVPEMLQTFDFPDPSIIFGQRDVTTVPTQALYMMNSAFVIEQSNHFAKRLLAETELEDAGRVELAYRLALARAPSVAESGEAQAFLAAACESLGDGEDARAQAWAGLCQALFASSEFRYVE